MAKKRISKKKKGVQNVQGEECMESGGSVSVTENTGDNNCGKKGQGVPKRSVVGQNGVDGTGGSICSEASKNNSVEDKN